MFNLLDNLIGLFSKEMRATNELGRLNIIWERFNNKENVLDDILSKKWVYHKDKVKLLLTFMNITNN